MRKTLKILHTFAACGLIGGLLCYMLLLVEAKPDSAVAYADLRWTIAALSNYVLLPSLVVALASGLLSMIAHQPFLDKGWAWIKAALGLLMFKGVLTIVGAKANYSAGVAQKIADGAAPADALDGALVYEWWTLVTILAVSIANIVLGVWRPRIIPRPKARARTAPVTPRAAEGVSAERAAAPAERIRRAS